MRNGNEACLTTTLKFGHRSTLKVVLAFMAGFDHCVPLDIGIGLLCTSLFHLLM